MGPRPRPWPLLAACIVAVLAAPAAAGQANLAYFALELAAAPEPARPGQRVLLDFTALRGCPTAAQVYPEQRVDVTVANEQGWPIEAPPPFRFGQQACATESIQRRAFTVAVTVPLDARGGDVGAFAVEARPESVPGAQGEPGGYTFAVEVAGPRPPPAWPPTLPSSPSPGGDVEGVPSLGALGALAALAVASLAGRRRAP